MESEAGQNENFEIEDVLEDSDRRLRHEARIEKTRIQDPEKAEAMARAVDRLYSLSKKLRREGQEIRNAGNENQAWRAVRLEEEARMHESDVRRTEEEVGELFDIEKELDALPEDHLEEAWLQVASELEELRTWWEANRSDQSAMAKEKKKLLHAFSVKKHLLEKKLGWST